MLIIIAGAGEAGVAAAAALRAAGHVGDVVLVSDEPGLPYERPPLSKGALQEELAQDTLIRPENWYAEQDITLLRSSCVTAIDAGQRIVQIENERGRQEARYDSLLIATGARPRQLPDGRASIRYLRTRDDARHLREALAAARRLVIIGGGVIGLEVAATARGRGLDVTVVDPAARLMARAVAPEISGVLLALHQRCGVDLVLNAGAVDVWTSSEGITVRAGGAEYVADVCVAGIGVLPNDKLGRMAGCVVDNGISVDGCGRTTVPGIFAAGDVAAFRHPLYRRPIRVEAWQHAGRHGAHVGRAMIGVTDDYQEIPWFWTDQFGVNVQVAGLPADCDETVWRGDDQRRTALHLKDGVLCGVTTIDNGRDMRPAINLLAAGWNGDPSPLSDETTSFREISRRLLEADRTNRACPARDRALPHERLTTSPSYP